MVQNVHILLVILALLIVSSIFIVKYDDFKLALPVPKIMGLSKSGENIKDRINIQEFLKGDRLKINQDNPKLVNHVRENFLVPPNNKPYNLKNPFKTNPSQYKQNLLVLKLLNNIKKGFFIECGALDGEFLSNTLFLERYYGWSGLLIEAKSDSYEKLALKNRKSWISNACLSTKPYPKIMNFYIDKTGISGLLSSSELMRDGFNYDPVLSYKVQCIPLYTFLVALNVSVIDYLSLDVEGADYDVLKTIPFDKVTFKVLEVETKWVKEGWNATKTYLESKGYIYVTKIKPDFIFIHSSQAKLINLKKILPYESTRKIKN